MRITEAPDEGKWEAFIQHHPQGNIFQSPDMYHLLNSMDTYTPRVLALIDTKDNIQGILAYNIIEQGGITGFFSRRSIIMGGPLVSDNNSELADELLQAYYLKIRKARVIYTQVRNIWDAKDLKSVFEKKFSFRDHLAIHLDLTKDEDVLVKELHKKRYSNIKRAIRKNLAIRPIHDEEGLLDLSRIVKKTYDRINIPSPPPWLFLNAQKKMGQRIHFLGAYSDDKLIAGRIYLLYKNVIYDWYAGSDLNYSNLQPNDLLPWEAILWAKKNGYTLYDFAGAGDPSKPYGVREYKMRFGGTIKNYGRYQCIHNFLLYRIGIIGMKLYKYLR